nr:uncharacterized protein LOC111510051 isoform X1 [Leptinotarsa decemlineata]
METPILTKKQQKLSLSAKKRKPKETIKNVLASSFNNFFWPKVPSEHHGTLVEILKNNLPRMKENRINTPWRELKKVPKADRKKFREDYIKNVTGQVVTKIESGGMCLGVNNVTKLLETNNADTVLIAGDVHPILMVQHLIDLAILYRVPVLILDDLRDLLKTHTGISSLALGVRKDIRSEPGLNLIKKTVNEIFANFPLPKNHINFNRSLKNESNDDADVGSENQVVESCVKVDENQIKQTVYLKRVSKQKRAFIPQLTDEKKTAKMEVDETGFLAFSDEPVKPKVVEPKYKSLVIKRLKGDPNRNKRKIENLKRKRGMESK